MRVNEGKADRWIRVLLGASILFLVPVTPWAWFGLLPLVTGITGYCPLYHALGISTCHKARVA